ncbi:hypothetical protein NUACC21_67950 [Scytonema sp. NUACC21]
MKAIILFLIIILFQKYYIIKPVKATNKHTIHKSQIAQIYTSQIHLDTTDKIGDSLVSQSDFNSREPKLEPLGQAEKNQNRNQQEILLDALAVSATKYPWLINPTDNLIFSPEVFKPNTDNYSSFDINFSKDNPNINKFIFAFVPKKEQFYWVLPNNKVVFETKAWQGGVFYQGRSTDTKIIQTITLKQALGGVQAVSVIPGSFDDLIGKIETKNFSIISIAGQITNPSGIPTDKVIINSGIELTNSNVTTLTNPLSNLGSGSTRSSNGGGSLFEFLDVSNSPLILQGFPTVDLKPLLNGGNIKLAEKEMIPKEVLEAAGIVWGDYVTGKPSQFTAPISSLPGIKIGQLGKFDNVNLLNKLVNPFQTDVERDLHYLNSLFWVSFGQRQPKLEVNIENQDEDNWHKLYFSNAHNRAIIEYSPTDISVSYANIFTNPGVSLIINFEDARINEIQSANSTAGMVLGFIFQGVDINRIQYHLDTAKQKFKNQEVFSALETKATSLQRRQINYRLNQTLSYANRVSGLKPVSGTITFPSKITTNNSNIIQLRTGLYRRRLQFLQEDVGQIIEGNTFFSNLKLSNKNFGNLSFISTSLPLLETSVTPNNNEASAAEVILTQPNGKSFVQRFSSGDNTVIPVGIKSSDLAFDRIELTRIDRQNIHLKTFNGYLDLPAIELVFAGSSGDFNYSATTGYWFNLDSNSAPGISHNIDLQEAALGIYTNILLNFQKINVQKNIKNDPKAIETHASFLGINWNSAININNPFSANLSYSYSYQNPQLGFSLTPGIAFVGSRDRNELTKFLTAQMSLKTGLECHAIIELAKELFFDLYVLQKINTNISVGAYIKNFSQINLGLDNRITNINYGIILKQNFTKNNSFLEAQIGTGEKGLDARLQGGLRF